MQTKEEFLEFENQLTKLINSDDLALGLIFLGSAAEHSRIDQWSDHDFFVVTLEGNAEQLRQDLSWLPNSENIVLSPRETAHGLKVLYSDGHVLEFAVFNDSELEIASANDFLVTVDKPGTIKERMVLIKERSATKAKESKFDPESTFEILLVQLLLGVGRARRGESLIAGEHIRSWAVSSLVQLFRFWSEPLQGTSQLTDNLNSLRRFEKQYPELGKALEKAQASSTEECAKLVLQSLVTSNFLSPKQLEQVNVIKKTLGW